jgi:eukaryotic-like serine/threonine-protein kinase
VTFNERDPQEDYEKQNSSMLQYFEDVDHDVASPQALFDDILTIEERYQESRVINHGGMKKIFKITDTLTNRSVAKATLKDFEDSDKVENFLREARLTSALEHPNIIPVYDIGVNDVEGPFFIMKLVGGQSLADLLKELSSSKTVLSLQELMDIFLRICDAVAYAHSKGIIHLDLKPDNIRIGDYGDVLVCDWGLAKVIDDPESVSDLSADLDPCYYNDVTLDGYIKGSPGYMAPEQVNTDLGPKDQRADIYALGGILYSLLTFQAPIKNTNLDNILKITLEGSITPPSERTKNRFVPPGLEAVSMKALQVNADKRYQKVSELRLDIINWMHGFATEAEKASFIKSFWLLLNRHKAVSFLLLVLLVFGSFGVYKIKQNEEKATNALAQFIKEKEEKKQINKFSLDQLLSLNKHLLDESKFDNAMYDIERSLVFQPDSEILNALKGEIHFYRQEFAEAQVAFIKAGSKSTDKRFKRMYSLCPMYEEISNEHGYIPAKELLALLSKFDEYKAQRLFDYEKQKFLLKENQAFSEILKQRNLLINHMKFCHLMMSRNKPESLNQNFTYSFDQDGINLDLSGISYDPSCSYIRHLPLKSLNVSNSSFWRKWIFKHYYLKAIDCQNCFIKKVSRSEIDKTKLKKITLNESLYENIKMKKENFNLEWDIRPDLTKNSVKEEKKH